MFPASYRSKTGLTRINDRSRKSKVKPTLSNPKKSLICRQGRAMGEEDAERRERENVNES